jgi:hypothetical protein
MAKVTIKQQNTINSETSEVTVLCERIGPFAIHRMPENPLAWTLSHARTGYAVQRHLPSDKRAEWLARKLMALKVWGFSDPQDVRKFDKDILAQITVLRADAMSGDCQGEIPNG